MEEQYNTNKFIENILKDFDDEYNLFLSGIDFEGDNEVLILGLKDFIRNSIKLQNKEFIDYMMKVLNEFEVYDDEPHNCSRMITEFKYHLLGLGDEDLRDDRGNNNER